MYFFAKERVAMGGIIGQKLYLVTEDGQCMISKLQGERAIGYAQV